jgi:hypothetical protein
VVVELMQGPCEIKGEGDCLLVWPGTGTGSSCACA